MVLWCGWPFFERAWISFVNWSFNMFTLITIGVGTAYLYSGFATIFADGFLFSKRGRRGADIAHRDTHAPVTMEELKASKTLLSWA